MSRPRAKASFIEPMECVPSSLLPENPAWTYELKLDGYRLEAVKESGKVTLYSRRRHVYNDKFVAVADALSELPDGTVIDGEIVAMDPHGRSDFNALQNVRASGTRLHYYAFDCLMFKGLALLNKPLAERRRYLAKVLPEGARVSTSVVVDRLPELMAFVREHGLEGVVAKRSDGLYEPGQRSGLWVKHRINLGQEFVVGGYTPGGNGFDALVVGVYRGKALHFASKVRAGFVPATRREVFAHLKGSTITQCPFANLPEKSSGRWGQGLTAEKMKECIWVKPQVVVRVDFLQWTDGDKLRHTKFVALRTDKDPATVTRET